jgi:hypothetical protein
LCPGKGKQKQNIQNRISELFHIFSRTHYIIWGIPIMKWYRLTPGILATQEPEIRRITVRSQCGQIVQETLSQKSQSQKKGLLEWLKV